MDLLENRPNNIEIYFTQEILNLLGLEARQTFLRCGVYEFSVALYRMMDNQLELILSGGEFVQRILNNGELSELNLRTKIISGDLGEVHNFSGSGQITKHLDIPNHLLEVESFLVVTISLDSEARLILRNLVKPLFESLLKYEQNPSLADNYPLLEKHVIKNLITLRYSRIVKQEHSQRMLPRSFSYKGMELETLGSDDLLSVDKDFEICFVVLGGSGYIHQEVKIVEVVEGEDNIMKVSVEFTSVPSLTYLHFMEQLCLDA